MITPAAGISHPRFCATNRSKNMSRHKNNTPRSIHTPHKKVYQVENLILAIDKQTSSTLLKKRKTASIV